VAGRHEHGGRYTESAQDWKRVSQVVPEPVVKASRPPNWAESGRFLRSSSTASSSFRTREVFRQILASARRTSLRHHVSRFGIVDAARGWKHAVVSEDGQAIPIQPSEHLNTPNSRKSPTTHSLPAERARSVIADVVMKSSGNPTKQGDCHGAQAGIGANRPEGTC
jgi:hypothetical protein